MLHSLPRAVTHQMPSVKELVRSFCSWCWGEQGQCMTESSADLQRSTERFIYSKELHRRDMRCLLGLPFFCLFAFICWFFFFPFKLYFTNQFTLLKARVPMQSNTCSYSTPKTSNMGTHVQREGQDQQFVISSRQSLPDTGTSEINLL